MSHSTATDSSTTSHAPENADPPPEMSHDVPQCPTSQSATRDTLSPAQRRAISLLLAGRRDAHAAREVGVNRRTLYRWRTQHRAFRAELARRRESLWHDSTDHLRALLPRALKVLARHLQSNYDATSFRAAASILKLATAGKLAPPNDPTDERDILRHEILKDRLRANDPNPTIEESDLQRKLQELLSDDPSTS